MESIDMTHPLLPGLERAKQIADREIMAMKGESALDSALALVEILRAIDTAIAEEKASVEAERRYEERYAALASAQPNPLAAKETP